MNKLGSSCCAESHGAVGYLIMATENSFTQILSASPRGQIASVTSHVGAVNNGK